jgi:hypothetical protein
MKLLVVKDTHSSKHESLESNDDICKTVLHWGLSISRKSSAAFVDSHEDPAVGGGGEENYQDLPQASIIQQLWFRQYEKLIDIK